MKLLKTIIAATLAAACVLPAQAADKTMSTDIVVLGAGCGGTSASVAAQELGAKVILLEKQGITGGTCKFSEGIMAVESKMQRDWNYGLTKDDAFQRIMRYGHWRGNGRVVRAFVEKTASTIDWMQGNGVKFEKLFSNYPDGLYTWHIYEGRGAGWLAKYQDKFVKNGGTLLLNTPATDLIQGSDGVVRGVIAKNKDGDKITINAKAVILATGGFGANHKMVEKYRPELKGFSTTNHPGATGDGIILAQQVGAGLTDIEQIQIHPTVIKKNGALISESMRARGGFLLNKNGKRFTNELLTRDVVSANELKQPGGIAYLVVDDSIYKKNKMLRSYVSEGLMKKCDTVADVAKMIGADPKVVQASFDQYHKAFDNKKDDLFGRPEMLIRMDQAPYFVAEVTPGIHHTMGGVKIDPQAEVLTPEKKPIPGLFAAGEVTGGVHGGNRIGGNAVADIITFGRISANSALKYIGK